MTAPGCRAPRGYAAAATGGQRDGVAFGVGTVFGVLLAVGGTTALGFFSFIVA